MNGCDALEKEREMKYIEIEENSPLYIDNQEYVQALEMLIQSSPELPIRAHNGLFLFDSYTVGSIVLDDLVISIKPRIKGFTVNDYFEMQLYAEGILNDNIESALSENAQYGLERNLTKVFLDSLEFLTRQGLDGFYIDCTETTNIIRGRIQTERITNLHLLYDELPIEYQEFSTDVSFNKIIKLALDKIKYLVDDKSTKIQYSQLYKYFEHINAEKNLLMKYKDDVKAENYLNNKKYGLTLNFAIKILDDLKVNFDNNFNKTVRSYSYLINSNTVYEKYLRRVLSDYLELPVTKWESPKEVAKIEITKDKTISKSIVPDILINYSPIENQAYIVLDAKNKDISNDDNLVSVSDFYQILYYSDNLRCQFAGLVYPNKRKDINSFSRVRVVTDQRIELYYFTLDFNLKLGGRHKKFLKDLKEAFQLK